MYVPYEFYKASYGGMIPESEYARAEAHAEAVIRHLTFHNGDIFAEENDDVKKAVCAAAEVIYQQTPQGSGAVAGAGSVKSVNNDGYSVSFSTEKTDGQTSEVFLQRKVHDAISVYLTHTGWLCRLLR